MSDKVAVVTGANKGIGYAIVKELCHRGVGVVYLTARDVTRGTEAVKNLKKDGFNPLFHQLEVSDPNSVKALANHLKEKYEGIDILINNAAVSTNAYSEIDYEDAKRVIDINYRSNLVIQEYLFPILKDNARVINISNDCGHISNIKNAYWIERLTNHNIKIEDIDVFTEWFLNSIKNGNLNKDDFKDTSLLAYKISKVALCALTRFQQMQVGRGISVNSLHPGFVQTDMTGNLGLLTAEESGKAPVFLALDVDQSVKGKYFWSDKTEREWTNPDEELYSKSEFLKFEEYSKEIGDRAPWLT